MDEPKFKINDVVTNGAHKGFIVEIISHKDGGYSYEVDLGYQSYAYLKEESLRLVNEAYEKPESLVDKVKHLEEEIDDLRGKLGSLKSLFTSLSYASPEMQGYWIEEIYREINES